VVQVYASRPDSSIERPQLWLVGFGAVEAEPGETVEVEIGLAPRAFEHWADGWAIEPGLFELRAGASSDGCPLRHDLTLVG
jgi:beta-glucosidase